MRFFILYLMLHVNVRYNNDSYPMLVMTRVLYPYTAFHKALKIPFKTEIDDFDVSPKNIRVYVCQ